MKRFHVHVSVSDLAQSIRFYSTLFGAEPAVVKHDYAKWMLEDPRVNFAISQRGGTPGISHLGLQTDADEELESLRTRLQQAELAASAEKGVACCYARSDKYWVTDPTGIAWEMFHTLGAVPTFGEEPPRALPTAGLQSASARCCADAPNATEAVQTVNPARAASACCA
jgi:catechol 2,3-dioxygenase-like lactoylglutathione lyase family enzyme